MAMSFARPDPSSPASIADAGFSTSRRGFDQAEVREFLRMIAAELGRLQERERFLERELRMAQANPDFATAQLDDAALTRLLGEETARVLTTARESAAEIREKAEHAAAQLVGEASDEAARMREEAEIEASRRRSDAAADAEAELSMAKQQGREMVNEARAYRERVLSELARRRELAREQIEQLLHGRDRLLQSFERARLVAVDVVAELEPLGEPDEYVNLTPTTGPVPVMVPNSPRPAVAEPVLVDADADSESDADAVGTEVDADAAEVDAVDQLESASREDPDPEAADTVEAEPDAGVDEVVADAPMAEAPELVAEADPVDDADADVLEGADDGGGDDVVVDLFARLRAEAVTTAPDETTEQAGAQVESDPGLDTVDDTPDDAVADEGEPSVFAQRDADLTPIIVAAARKLKRVLADEQNQVLEALRRNDPARALDEFLPDRVDHVARYIDSVTDDLHAAAAAGAAMVGGTDPLREPDSATAVVAASEVLGEWLVDPLRDRLERCLADGDGDNADVSKRVRSIYREWKTQHIDEQLDDVVRAAHGRGVLAAIPSGTPVVWVCDDAHPSCSDCDDNTLAGAVAAGDPFPTGNTFAPAHVGCRCLLLPERS